MTNLSRTQPLSVSVLLATEELAIDLRDRRAQSTLRALNVELTDEAAEASSPLGLPNGSLEAAVMSLPLGSSAALSASSA